MIKMMITSKQRNTFERIGDLIHDDEKNFKELCDCSDSLKGSLFDGFNQYRIRTKDGSVFEMIFRQVI